MHMATGAGHHAMWTPVGRKPRSHLSRDAAGAGAPVSVWLRTVGSVSLCQRCCSSESRQIWGYARQDVDTQFQTGVSSSFTDLKLHLEGPGGIQGDGAANEMLVDLHSK